MRDEHEKWAQDVRHFMPTVDALLGERDNLKEKLYEKAKEWLDAQADKCKALTQLDALKVPLSAAVNERSELRKQVDALKTKLAAAEQTGNEPYSRGHAHGVSHLARHLVSRLCLDEKEYASLLNSQPTDLAIGALIQRSFDRMGADWLAESNTLKAEIKQLKTTISAENRTLGQQDLADYLRMRFNLNVDSFAPDASKNLNAAEDIGHRLSQKHASMSKEIARFRQERDDNARKLATRTLERDTADGNLDALRIRHNALQAELSKLQAETERWLAEDREQLAAVALERDGLREAPSVTQSRVLAEQAITRIVDSTVAHFFSAPLNFTTGTVTSALMQPAIQPPTSNLQVSNPALTDLAERNELLSKLETATKEAAAGLEREQELARELKAANDPWCSVLTERNDLRVALAEVESRLNKATLERDQAQADARETQEHLDFLRGEKAKVENELTDAKQSLTRSLFASDNYERGVQDGRKQLASELADIVGPDVMVRLGKSAPASPAAHVFNALQYPAFLESTGQPK